MLSRLSASLLALLLLSACQQYDFSVNDKVVYTPHPLFSDFAAADPALQQCIEKTIKDRKITQMTQLKELSCRSAGIESLEGLAAFTALQELDLSDNSIVDISELAAIGSLSELYLTANQILDPSPLTDLPALDSLDLSANKSLRCPNRQTLLRVGRLQLPRHCG
ncbi:leucine-rich repeat domain-containing protein [Parahaliea sp. F7430]|uniref:Leucine-rich repeat domain-containing protein n=1 Tax=Sediminihaliea albiluteola TaxID=2758564 RepID=A0A7W2TVN7_9GAMM|nr:leucine-rich repeat domain-containing protein [Sediminihaliea albiluteola]MBA6412765.1 leucine-rich repeat domain-containing protein [Sediminihaliea albiluteola]